MEYDHVRKLLSSVGDPKASKELAGLVEEFQQTDHWKLVRAVSDHLISQNLRGGQGGLEGYGRAQGINAVPDFFSWIKEFAKAGAEGTKDENQPETELRHPVQGGYGIV